MKKIYIVLFLLSVVVAQGFAQNKKADKLFTYYKYAAAIPLYEKTLMEGSGAERKHAIQRLAHCYRLINNERKAKEWYERILRFKDADPINYYYLGQALRSLGMYTEAAEAFRSFNNLVAENEDGKRYLQFCSDIQPWLELPPMADVKNIETLNTKYSDFAPVFYRDGIVFTSDRLANLIDKSNVYGWTNFSYLNLFYTIPEYHKVFWNGVPEPKKMSADFNHSFHDGPACFSSDDRWIYVTKTIVHKGKRLTENITTHLLKIYYAEITGEKKPDFKSFPYNSDEYSVGHPTLSKDGKKIIFSSDMPGGYGGSDLYLCIMEDEKWGEPINLGENVNSPGNEVFPYWGANDSLLFFSSNGHLGYGGLDIFKSELDGTVWQEPENLKAPLNSSYDDFGIVFKEETMTEGLFSSNRPEGRGNDDIYGFRDLKYVSMLEQDEEATAKFEISGAVKDVNGTPIKGATVFLLDPITKNVKVLNSDENGLYQDNVEFNQNYVVKAMKDDYIYDCTTFRTPVGEEGIYNVPQDLVLMKLEVDQMFEVENIYYDLDKWYIRKDAEAPLDNLVRILKEFPITAELSSHTDCRASNEYNRELSQKRAESAVRYIILQGVNPARITAKGYGETKLVNKCKDGVDCTEEEHQANRRTEFKITSVGTLDGDDFIDLGNFKEGDIIPARTLGVQFFDNCSR